MVKPPLSRSVEVQVALGAVASLLMLISIGCVSYYSTNHLVDTEKWVAHTHEVIATLEQGLVILTDAETKQRGYLLTGNEEFKKDSQLAQTKIASWYTEIRLLTADNPQAQRELDALNSLISQRLTALNQRMKLGPQPLAADANSLKQGRVLMDKIYESVEAMRATEDQLLLKRQIHAERDANLCQIVIVSGSAIACAIGISAFLMARHGLHLREQAQRELSDSRNLMASILDNTPAIVFIKDLAGKYLFVNQRFAEVVGRPRETIVGKTAFDIAAKETAELAEKHFRTVMTTENALEVEETVQYPDGPHAHLAIKFPVRDLSGKIWAMGGISTDISERKQVEERINAANEQLRVANKELEAFSYSASHDLRAPLRHIDGFVGLLRKQVATRLDEKEIRYLNTIATSAQQMGALIDDLLIFSRMGRVELRRAPVSMNTLVDEVLRGLHHETEARHINWKVAQLPEIQADAAMLRQVWVNLLHNAVKYTRPRDPAEIEIGCDDTADNEWVFSVRDNGVGFDMQYAHKLFGVFQRLHRADEFEGTGIGLANVQRIINRHGGRTWAESKPDKGATIYFSLPKPTENRHNNHGTVKKDTAG